MMGDTAQSTRRRHILSSINPDSTSDQSRNRFGATGEDRRRERKRYRDESKDRKDGTGKDSVADVPLESGEHDRHTTEGEVDMTKPRPSRLKLKHHRSRRHPSRERERDDRDRHRDRHHDRYREDEPRDKSHRRYHKHRRRHRSPTPPNPYEKQPLDPEAAFRESLFDAMADDEGASYWEGVYGQPVHVYSNEKVGPTGELEQMTEEEYAAYVRQKMWEKTNAGLLEERARREQEKKRREEKERHNRKLQEEMEHSLRRGEERRQRRMWSARWDAYQKSWSVWDGSLSTLDWPVESGQRNDVDESRVREFFMQGLGMSEEAGGKGFAAGLKDERVRWHPDKIQQRLGGQVDDSIMKHVTSIFQTIDRLWGDARKTS
ncbi:hypothetical protein BGZ63DRAFT_262333 [Mariannaea sp. PMI_226]|nr:hypothetical protein BGZ63DRAFT_262333 [Mariannaea sp. PMI_226]